MGSRRESSNENKEIRPIKLIEGKKKLLLIPAGPSAYGRKEVPQGGDFDNLYLFVKGPEGALSFLGPILPYVRFSFKNTKRVTLALDKRNKSTQSLKDYLEKNKFLLKRLNNGKMFLNGLVNLLIK